MRLDDFPPDVACGIVAHMNEDHADAVLAIARAHGAVPTATSARMVAITPVRLDIEVDSTVTDGHTQTVAIRIEPPIEPLDTVRARLVALTRSARAALTDGSA